MSLYANIKFSNDLIENEACNITYSGYLFEKNSTCVSIVYGFGPEWNHTTEQKMEKTDEGFVATVNMRDFDTFNFCFKNLDNEWDNNYNQNYTSPISKPVINETQNVTEPTPEYDFVINNENVITNILENLFATDLSDEIYNEPLKMDTDIVEEPVKSEAIETTSFEVEVEINEPVNIEETLVNVTEIEALSQDIENLFNDIYENAVEEKVETTQETVITENIVEEVQEASINEVVVDEVETPVVQNFENESLDSNGEFNMDNLINEILSPIVKSSVFDEDIKDSLENYAPVQNNSVNFFDDFEDFEDDLSVDNKIDSLIADLFNNTKAARTKTESEATAIENSVNQAEVTDEPLFVENIEVKENNVVEFESSESELEKAIDNRIEELLSTEPEVETIEENNIENIEIADSTQENVEQFEENEPEEESLIDVINNSEDEATKALIEISNGNDFVVSPRSLGKFYMFKKKVKLAFTKLFVALPRFLSKGLNNENN